MSGVPRVRHDSYRSGREAHGFLDVFYFLGNALTGRVCIYYIHYWGLLHKRTDCL
jgi:hypothetical protein